MINPKRMTARMDEPFVLFLIGMRFNRLWKVTSWWPVVTSMPRMIRELYQHPELGFLGAESWFGRTTLMLQYWRSLDQLLAFATDKTRKHLPAWQHFNRQVMRSGDVGIWHETYQVQRGGYENVYTNMPRFGLGRVGTLVEASGPLLKARDRMGSD